MYKSSFIKVSNWSQTFWFLLFIQFDSHFCCFREFHFTKQYALNSICSLNSLHNMQKFWAKSQTVIIKIWIINVYCQQVLVVGSFKRSSFLVHVSHKNLKLIFFPTYLICNTKAKMWVKMLVFRGWNYKKLFNNHEKATKKRKELLKQIISKEQKTWMLAR